MGGNIQLSHRAELTGDVSVAPIFDETGTCSHLIGSVHDITERKQAESELREAYEQITASEEELRSQYNKLAQNELQIRESEEKFHALYMHMIEGAALHELTYDDHGVPVDYIIIETNPAFEKHIGISRDSVIGKTSRDAYGVSEAPYLETYARVVLTGMPEVFETYFPPMDKYFSISAYCPAKGRFATIFEDITKRRRAEEEVIFKNLILSTQQETSLNGILIVDEQGKILNFNQKFVEIWGIPPEFIESRVDEPVLQYVVEQVVDSEAFLSRVRYLYDHKNEKSFEEITLKDGRILERFSAPIIGENEIYYGRVWYFRDISELKRAEDALHLVNRRLNLLTGITRHDILNKISIVLGNLKFAEKKFKDPALVEILKKTETAATAIRSQIEFTRTYQDLGVQVPAWFQVCDVIRSTRPPEISLTCTCEDCEIFADPMIAKVFFNLFDNAVKHGNGVTTVTIECRPLRDELVIVFADNGVGIPPDEKERIFERGFGRNTGLGLFLAREILSITGITIRETGEHGAGAKFEIIVPRAAYRFAHIQKNPGTS